MDTKVLLTGIISFIAGALVVSTAAVTIEKPLACEEPAMHGASQQKAAIAQMRQFQARLRL
jgi:hypothetical protein